MFVENWAVSSDKVAMEARAACQSLGAFYVAPTLVARRFLARLANRIMYTCEPSTLAHGCWSC